MGEIVKPGLLAQYEQAPVEKIIGTSVADRVVDVLSIFISYRTCPYFGV